MHAIYEAVTSFVTDPADPSEITGQVRITGQKNRPLSMSVMGLSTYMPVGSVIIQQLQLVQYLYIQPGGGPQVGFINRGVAQLQITPADMQFSELIYQERPGATGTPPYFDFILVFTGSFGDGPEGDLRGMPFVDVPTPGATTIALFAALVALRRRQR